MIRLDIGSLPEGHSHWDLEEDVLELDIVLEGGRLVSPVDISLEIDKNDDEIFLVGRATVRAELECARCLEAYDLVLAAPFEAVLLVGEGEAGSDDRENLIRVPGGTSSVDLTDQVRTELLVRVPIKPLCRQDCVGLCPTCGTNLNVERCSCRQDGGDSRWDALKRLKKNT